MGQLAFSENYIKNIYDNLFMVSIFSSQTIYVIDWRDAKW